MKHLDESDLTNTNSFVLTLVNILLIIVGLRFYVENCQVPVNCGNWHNQMNHSPKRLGSSRHYGRYSSKRMSHPQL